MEAKTNHLWKIVRKIERNSDLKQSLSAIEAEFKANPDNPAREARILNFAQAICGAMGWVEISRREVEDIIEWFEGAN